jgi:hypothetical protein
MNTGEDSYLLQYLQGLLLLAPRLPAPQLHACQNIFAVAEDVW